MRAYIIRRLLLLIPTVLLVSLIVFITMRLIPGDIIDAMTAESFLGGGGGTASAAVDRAKMERRLGLDVPVATQYGRWIGVLPDKDGNINGILQGNLGNSMWRGTPVMEDVVARWPVTLELSIMGLILAQLIALPIGIYSALRQDTAGDYIGRSFAIACIAIPYFWLGTLVIVFPAIWWNYMPPLRFMRLTEDPITNLSQMVMPAIILGMLLSGVTMRMTRAMMLEVLRQDYIRTAWAKGLRERVVVIRHALKNALIPVITIVGLQVPIMIGGTVIIEKIFILPGMGSLLLDALLKRDYPVMSGVLVIFAGAMVAINLIVDVAYAYLDPRIHY